MRTEINFILGKNEVYMPSSLGGRSIVVVKQANENFAFAKFLKFDHFNSKVCFSYLNAPIASFVPIDKWPEAIIIFLSIPTIKYYHTW